MKPVEQVAQIEKEIAELEKTYNAARTELLKKLSDTKKSYQAEALGKIRALMLEHGISEEELKTGKVARKGETRTSKPVDAKYRGPEGQTWTGRGRQPKWLGDDREKFRIASKD